MHLSRAALWILAFCISFNSPYLGFFLASWIMLWKDVNHAIIFQFPLLGIFPCIVVLLKKRKRDFTYFQFPLLGIFPCIKFIEWLNGMLEITFQFPLLGIFPCINMTLDKLVRYFGKTFNSPYLGFFLASTLTQRMQTTSYMHFQFPLLGIFPCIDDAQHPVGSRDKFLSIPLTWDFSLHLERRRISQ